MEKQVSFLSNTPIDDDLFEGKPREKIAIDIAQVLTNDENDKNKIIGIDGGWGVGKSSVVKQIEKQKEIKEGYHFFVYDAWGHQEDLQRRSILEELTENLLTAEPKPLLKEGKENWKIYRDAKNWEDKLKKLLAKHKETDTKKTSKLSLTACFFVLALAISPMIAIIAESMPSFVWKLILALVPLSLLLLSLAVVAVVLCRKKKLDDGKKILDELLCVYQGTRNEENISETISENDPSVKQFRQWMEDLSDDLTKKLVIVFDNMDRLPSNKVQELWSSIHIFFAEKKYENIYVIVPFDRAHIINAFKDNNIISQNKNGNDKCFGNDFIDKTFDIVYRVSPPILTDWKKFFEIKWEEAFGKLQDDERHEFDKIKQIYSFLGKDVTPRKIIALINEVVGTYRVNPQIPLRYIVLFIIGKEAIQLNPAVEIIMPTYLKGLNFIYEDDKNLPKYIAALYYQIDPENAIQVVYLERLTKALNNNVQEEVGLIYNSPIFEAIIDDVIPLVENIENAILSLAKHENIKGKVWDDLYRKVKKITIKGQKITEAQLILLEKTNYRKAYLQYLLTQFSESNEKEDINLVDYATSIDKILKEDLGFPIQDCMPEIDVAAEKFMQFVERYKEKYNSYKVACEDNDELNTFLSEDTNAKYLDLIQYIKNDYDLSALQDAITDKIKKYPNNKTIIAQYLPFLKEISEKIPNDLIAANHLYSMHTQSSDSEDIYYDFVAMRIAQFNSFSSPYVPYFANVLSSQDEQIANKVAEQIEYYTTYGEILINLIDFNNLLTVKIVNILTTDKNDSKRDLDINAVLPKFKDISDYIDENLLFAKLNRWSEDLKLNEENIKNVIPDIHTYEVALKANNSLTQKIVDVAAKYLDQLNHESWKEQFQKNDSYEVRLSLILSDYEYKTNATDAFIIVMGDIAKGSVSLDESLIGEILEKLKLEVKQAIFRNIRDLYCSSAEIDETKFQLFGSWLFEFGDLEKRENVIRRIFKTSIVRDDACLDIIVQNKDQLPAIIGVSDKADADGFKATIRSLLDEDNPKASEIAQLIGVCKSKKKDDIKEDNVDKE